MIPNFYGWVVCGRHLKTDGTPPACFVMITNHKSNERNVSPFYTSTDANLASSRLPSLANRGRTNSLVLVTNEVLNWRSINGDVPRRSESSEKRETRCCWHSLTHHTLSSLRLFCYTCSCHEVCVDTSRKVVHSILNMEEGPLPRHLVHHQLRCSRERSFLPSIQLWHSLCTTPS